MSEPASSHASFSTMSRKRGKVLVVDDDPVILEVVRERLDAAGFDVYVREEALGTNNPISSCST
jgi:PleD family two-component response regulator